MTGSRWCRVVLLVLLGMGMVVAEVVPTVPDTETVAEAGQTKRSSDAPAVELSTSGSGLGSGLASVPVEANMDALEPDWSVFEILEELPDIEESIRVVQSIPVQYFWDFHKGQFKFGILGESVEAFYPQFVTNSKMKFSVDSPVYNVTSANTEVIFSHLVLVVQYLARKIAGELGSTVNDLLAESDNFALKIIRIANETGIEWRTANEIRTNREVIEIKKDILTSELLRTMTRDRYRNATFHYYSEEKFKLLEVQHGHILDAIVASHARQDEMEIQKQEDLMRLSEETEKKRRETQISILQHAHISAIERLAVEVQLGVKAIRFRATEEGQVDRENEDLAVHIMQAKGESLRKGFEEIVTMLHLKATMLVQDAFDNPAFVFRYVLIVAAGLSLCIILLETAQVCHYVTLVYLYIYYHNIFTVLLVRLSDHT